MLSNYYKSPVLVARMRVGPNGADVERFAQALYDAQYGQYHAYGLLEAAWHIADWAAERCLPLDGLASKDLDRFASHATRCDCLGGPRGRKAINAKKRARVFLHYLKHGRLGDWSKDAEKPLPVIGEQFLRWMKDHRGLRDSSLENYRYVLCRIFSHIGEEPEAYTPTKLRLFVMARGSRCHPATTKADIVVLRSFVRYLVSQGSCPQSLRGAIPRFRHPQPDPLPAVLTSSDIERVLRVTNPGPSGSLRDHAVLLLLLRLGLRAGDVAALKLADVRWEEGLIRLCGKGRRETSIPLPQEVGDAILDYIRDERPMTPCCAIFLRTNRPIRGLTSGAVTSIWRRVLRRAGIENPAPGKQLLRHTAATQLAQSGLRPESIRTILRHQSVSMTAHYMHTDSKALKGVIQPWHLAAQI